MAYAEKRGRGPAPWRVKYKQLDGSEGSESGFETKKAALEWGRERESEARRALRGESPPPPQAGSGAAAETDNEGITLDTWIVRWEATQDVGISTEVNREYRIRRFIRPQWGDYLLTSITTEEVNAWEKELPARESHR